MKILTTTAALATALDTVKPAVPRKATLPILGCVRLEATGGELHLTATDLETTLRTSCALHDTDREGAVAVPFGRLYKTIQALPDSDVTLSVSDEYTVTISTDAGHYQLMGYDVDDWPDLPSVGGTDVARITAQSSDLRDALERVLFAVSQDAVRPAMMGVCVETIEGGIRLVATDGHRLSTAEVRADESLKAPIIIPEAAAKILLRMCKTKDRADVVLDTDGNHVRAHAPGGILTSRLIDETYPDWQQVMPDGNDRRLVVGRRDLLAAVERVRLYASSMTTQMRLEIGQYGALVVRAEDLERAAEAEEALGGEWSYDAAMEIGFNADYVREALATCEGADVTLWLSGPNRAAIVEDDRGGQMLIMPVMLNTYA